MNVMLKFKLFQTATYCIVFSAIAIMSLVTGKYIETVALFAGFVWLRYEFDKTYHCSSFWGCICITIIIFVVAISFVPKVNLSLLFSVVFALLIDYLAYKYKDYQDLKEIYNKPFNVDTCTEIELLTRCRELGFSQENTQLAIELFINKLSRKAISEKYFIEIESVKKKKHRMKQKLNK